MLDVTDQMRMREELGHAQKMEAVGASRRRHRATTSTTLLTVIIGNLELLCERIGRVPELGRFAASAVLGCEPHAPGLLAFGRKAQLSLKLLDPNELVRSTMALMRRLVGDEVRLETELAHDLPQIHVDPLEIERRARQFGHQRAGLRCRVVASCGSARAQRGQPGTLMVELAVEDEGPRHRRDQIERTSSSPSTRPVGTPAEPGSGSPPCSARRSSTAAPFAWPRGQRVALFSRSCCPPSRPARRSKRLKRKHSTHEHETRALTLLVIDDEALIADVTRRILEKERAPRARGYGAEGGARHLDGPRKIDRFW